ncbi:MAG: hypothetical protein LCH93_01190 [Proteobacteria bacterium]|nr:hypothetical protein [Pseudomonadota bacterium]
MNPDRISRARTAVRHLSRADLRALSLRIGATRDELTDFAELPDAALPVDSLAGFEQWFSAHELRGLFGHPRNVVLVATLPEASGIHPIDLDAFREGRTDLTDEQRQRISDHFTGKSKPATVSGTIGAPPPVMFALRGEAMRIVNGMSDDQLAAFVRDHSPAKAA